MSSDEKQMKNWITFSRPKRGFQGTFYWPVTHTQPFVERMIGQSRHLGEFNNSVGLSPERKVSVLFIVSSLFTKSRPLTIALAVISVIIETINRGLLFTEPFDMSKITLMHVFNKISKVLPFAFNIAAAIVVKIMSPRVIASRSYSFVDAMKTTVRQSVFMTHMAQV